MTALNFDAIRTALSPETRARLASFDVFAEIASTNTYLSEHDAPAAGEVSVAIADHQTAGRGRRDNTWISAPGDSLCLSLAYTFRRMPFAISALSLALGVAAARAFADIGVRDIGLKWPNDILAGNAKLGGILAETQIKRPGEVNVVAGIGVNVRVPAAAGDALDSSWAAAAAGLDKLLEQLPEREALAAGIVEAWVGAFKTFGQSGFEPFENDYRKLDWLHGKALIVESPDGPVTGMGAGIDREGALVVDCDRGRHIVLAGSVRAVGVQR